MMMLPQIKRERVVTWAFGIGLFIFLLVAVAMPVLNDALNNFNENVTRSIAYAQSQQYIKIPLDPSYTETIGPRGSDFLLVMDSFNFTKIISATVNFNVFVKADTTFFAYVDGKECMSPKFFVQGGSSQQVSFDCSNILIDTGKYIVTIYADNPVLSAFGWTEISYFSLPMDICPALPDIPACPAVPDVKLSVSVALKEFGNPPNMLMHGTEYQSGTNGTVFLQLLDTARQPINNSVCNLKIWYPDKTVFLNDVQMTYLLNSAGLYYYDFVVPNMTGIYMLSAKCDFYYNLTYLTSLKDSYVQATANTTNFGNLNYTVVGYASLSAFHSYMQFDLTNFTNATQATAVYLYLYEQGFLGYSYVKLQRVTSSWNESNITWINQPSVNGTIISGTQMAGIGWYAWNITDVYNKWINGTYSNYGLLLNSSPYGGTWNFSSFVSREANNDYVPRLQIFYNTSEQINEIRGSGEVHVSESVNMTNIAENVWNYTNRTLTQNITVLVNLTSVTSRLDQMNGTINSILSLSQQINLTVNQTLALAQSVNLTAVQTLQLLQDMNLTQAQIQQTVNQINLTVDDIRVIVNNTNFTVDQILAISQAINLTAVQTLAIAIDINLTSAQMFSLMQNLNVSSLGYLSDINATINNNALSLQQILGLANQTNLTTQQILSLLQQINTTFEIKLDNLNDSAGLLLNLSGEINATTHEVNVTVYQILAVVQGINITALQTYQLLQAMNLTQWQVWNILLGMNTSISQVLNLSNLAYINTNDILFLSIQTNSTVNQILGIVQGLNISLNQTISGNITLSTNLTSQTLNDISEKVWLQFLTLGTPPPMPSTSYYCSSNITLVKNITFDVCSGAGCKQYTKLTNAFCEFGCDTKNNQCVPPPINRMGFIAIVIIGILGFIIIARRFA